MDCDSCKSHLDVDEMVTLAIFNGGDRSAAVLCSPDCLLDWTAKMFAIMNEGDINGEVA